MTKRLLLTFLSAGVLLSSGCMFFKKSAKEKESSALASETEKVFRERWIARRASELAAQGIAAPAAQQQASQEFVEKYSFARPELK